MLFINKITSHTTVDFAAEEFKKYLRMMMPEAGDVRIAYDPHATEGFRLGLMQDLGLDVSDAEDTELDDILYIDTDENGGILAGDNPRSVLLAVYEFLRQNGCRWLFPGVDGEWIPMRPIHGVTYRHKPSCRYRGPCIEGAISQQILLETLDFLPKVGVNLFMMQFFSPTPFFTRYYTHQYNTVLPSEQVSFDTMLQWKTAAEAEMSKRGIQFHDVGHGWTVAPFGIDTSSGWTAIDEGEVPEESRRFLALFNGERKLWEGSPLITQFCMSNREARERIAEAIADYAMRHTNVDYIHLWLGDGIRNHCECEECQRKTVSDWYVLLLNEVDRVLTQRGLTTRIVFIVYTDTTWAPLEERIANPARFTMMLAPIARSYTRSMTDAKPATVPFVRNKIRQPKDLDSFMAYYDEWRKVWDGACFAFEYHFHSHLCLDPSGFALAMRVIEDSEAYSSHRVDGMIACATQRAYFPNGFAFYVFARKQFDGSLTYEELLEDYFLHAYGSEWKEICAYLETLSEIFDQKYMEGQGSADPERSLYYAPERAALLRGVREVTEQGREKIRRCIDRGARIRSVSAWLLEQHADYCDLLASVMAELAEGNRERAEQMLQGMREEMSRREPLIERYYDHYLTITTLDEITKK